MIMNYWLVESEPETYSFDDLKRDKRTVWDGVRNFAARNNLRDMKRGDLALFYHSGGKDRDTPYHTPGRAQMTRPKGRWPRVVSS